MGGRRGAVGSRSGPACGVRWAEDNGRGPAGDGRQSAGGWSGAACGGRKIRLLISIVASSAMAHAAVAAVPEDPVREDHNRGGRRRHLPPRLQPPSARAAPRRGRHQHLPARGRQGGGEWLLAASLLRPPFLPLACSSCRPSSAPAPPVLLHRPERERG